MVGKVYGPDVIQSALAYRAGGWSVSAISQKTGVSVATLERWFRDHKVKKGKLSEAAVTRAAAELKASVTADIKKEITSAIVDDIATFKLARSALVQNLQELMNDTSIPPHYRSRGIVGLVTGMKLTSDMIAKTLQIHNQLPDAEELPQLTVMELTASEIAEIRQAQVGEAGANPSDVDFGPDDGGYDDELIEESDDG